DGSIQPNNTRLIFPAGIAYTNPYGFALGDANKDGTQDLVVALGSDAVFISLKLGDRSVSDFIQPIFGNPPTNLGATHGDRNSIINFSPVQSTIDQQVSSLEGNDNIQYKVSSYQYFLDGILLPQYQSQPTTLPDGPYIVTQSGSTSGTVYGLANGTNYTLKVRAMYKGYGAMIYAPKYTAYASVQLSPTGVPPVPAGPAPVLASATNIINVSASV
ncbi:MAG: hypothetical protein ACK47R_06325, partial [Planctomycetia bacterium]